MNKENKYNFLFKNNINYLCKKLEYIILIYNFEIINYMFK